MSPRRGGAVAGEAQRQQVRAHYAKAARGGGCCSTEAGAPSCCGDGSGASACGRASCAGELGYSAEELSTLPDGADLGLGCGHPTAILALEPGQVVLDLGSGAGIDCFLAARKVGAGGHVIGVDMTPEMVGKARENCRKGDFSNVEFRLGEIEQLPVADRSVDVVLSNCVINLVPEKAAVYREAFRVLRPGGHLAISDVVATRPISARDRADPSLWSSCSSGALEVKQVKALLRRAGFRDVRLDLRVPGRMPASLRPPSSLGVVSADIRADKPRA
jgi:arsenite methyltransferase